MSDEHALKTLHARMQEFHETIQEMLAFKGGRITGFTDEQLQAAHREIADDVRSFSIKDHRNWPKEEDCGPGFGELDHYKLLHPVAFAGLDMPLACENIFAPLVPRPENAEGVDVLAKRAREFLEVVIAGLQVAK